MHTNGCKTVGERDWGEDSSACWRRVGSDFPHSRNLGFEPAGGGTKEEWEIKLAKTCFSIKWEEER